MKKQKHLTIAERTVIQDNLSKGKSLTSIAVMLSRSTTSISNEVKKHIVVEQKGSYGRPFNDCAQRFNCHETDVCDSCRFEKSKSCRYCNSCTSHCSKYQKSICNLLKKSPYVCNGCENRYKCTLEKHFYYANTAQKEYERTLHESRVGVNISEEELTKLNDTVSKLIINGQSIHHVCSNHADEIQVCEKTLYKYIGNGMLQCKNIDMPRVVRFKPRKGKKQQLKVDKKCRIGRTYEDFKNYTLTNPEQTVTEFDTVEGVKGGPVLLTMYFRQSKLQLAFLRESNNSKSVTEINQYCYEKLGRENYCKIFSLILTDNGTEFSNPTAIEKSPNGETRSHVFYCDASSPGQKGACENNHEFIRKIIPQGVDLGKYNQEDINLMMSHINSYGRPDLNDKSPYEMFSFLYGEDILKELGIEQIPRDDIILKPSLLKRN